jgi:hypothetical protein
VQTVLYEKRESESDALKRSNINKRNLFTDLLISGDYNAHIEKKVCKRCGAVETLYNKVGKDQMCSHCRKTKETHSYQAKMKKKEASRIEREKKVEQEIKNGKRLRCNCCKKYVLLSSLSANKKSTVCKRCAKFHIDSKEHSDYVSNSRQIKEIKKKEAKLSFEQKAQKANAEKDMIAQFLQSKIS